MQGLSENCAHPDDPKSAEAAPPICAKITTYNALRNAGVRGGDLVAVQDVGERLN